MENLLSPLQFSDLIKIPVSIENTGKSLIISGCKTLVYVVTFSDQSICFVSEDTASGIKHCFSI